MFVLLLPLLLTVPSTNALDCIANCVLGPFTFGQEFTIPSDQCPDRVSKNSCRMLISFDYARQIYYADMSPTSKTDQAIQISERLPFSYNLGVECSSDSNCLVMEARRQISELVRRPYNVTAIYASIYKIIGGGIYNRIDCFNVNSGTVTCATDEVCVSDYDHIRGNDLERGCKADASPRVFILETPIFASFEIICDYQLCNGLVNARTIREILASHKLTQENGKIIVMNNSPTGPPPIQTTTARAKAGLHVVSWLTLAFALISHFAICPM